MTGIRARFWGLYALLAVGVIVVCSLIGAVVSEALTDPSARQRALGLVWMLGLGLCVLMAGVWWGLYQTGFRALERLTRDLWMIASGDTVADLSLRQSRLLDPLLGALVSILKRLREVRRTVAETAAATASRVDSEKARLEAILRDLREGVLVCDLNSRILLYNPAALQLLQGGGELGLGRSLFVALSREPVMQALDVLYARWIAGAVPEADALEASFIGSTVDGGRLVNAHLRLVIEPGGACKSYVLSLSDATEPTRRETEPRRRAMRPLSYDFDLLHAVQVPGTLAEQPLRALRFVVFDSETTGLQPTQGDEIVALAGVPVVNGRVLSSESFERLVNPGRPIPPSSTVFHGITDAMVRDQPAITAILKQFHTFCRDAVLVAHNAAFDMKFITLKQHQAGVEFDQPVLDTLLLAMVVGGEWQDRSLEGIAARLQVTVVNRHSALGDALVTAQVFARLLDLLEAKDIKTLGQALAASDELIQSGAIHTLY
ncbi:MAG: exonuclease domain-containing protein [Gammaproteobacteria bacterium]